jgi:hypothetical protein
MSSDDASVQMGELVARRADADARVEQLEVEQQAAARARIDARAALVEAERRGVSAAERGKAEKAVADAEAKPTIIGARVEGARAAARDLEGVIQKYVAEHLDELLDELAAQGERAASAIDAGAAAILDGYAARAEVERQTFELISMIRRSQTSDVERSTADELARQAKLLLDAGGERRPVVLVDPRQPRHGQVASARSAA